MAFFWGILLIVVILVAWCTNVVGLPGNWLILAIAVLYWMLRPAGAGTSLSTIALEIIAALAVLGELLEVLMSSAGVAKAGGGRRGAVYAICGSVIGGCAGLVIGVPLPVFGSIAGSLFFGVWAPWRGRCSANFHRANRGRALCGSAKQLSLVVPWELSRKWPLVW